MNPSYLLIICDRGNTYEVFQIKSMRLDQFLKISRIIKRRTLAKAACGSGKVLVNGHPAKAGKELHEGDILRIDFGSRVLTCEVLSIPKGNVSAGEASFLYKVISEARP